MGYQNKASIHTIKNFECYQQKVAGLGVLTGHNLKNSVAASPLLITNDNFFILNNQI